MFLTVITTTILFYTVFFLSVNKLNKAISGQN
jgi:hypothetical protein